MNYIVSDKILEEFRDKTIEEIFEEIDIIENEYGEFCRIRNPFDKINSEELISKDQLVIFKNLTNRKLTLVNGVSDKRQIHLKRKNMNEIKDLIGLSAKLYDNAEDLDSKISCDDALGLKQHKKIREEDLLFCVNPEDLLFVDIETTGQQNAEIFLIGIGYIHKDKSSKKYEFTTELLFAREISEEASVLYYFLEQLPKYKMLVTYNGKMFDIPFIMNRIISLFEPDDLSILVDNNETNNESISRDDPDKESYAAIHETTYRIFKTFVHLDLYFLLKRTYKGLLPNYRLVTTEEQLLDFYRDEHLPSEHVPTIYIDWIGEPEKYMGGLYKVLEHNFYDVLNMEKLLREWISHRVRSEYNYLKASHQLKSKSKSPKASNESELTDQDIIQELKKTFEGDKRPQRRTLDEFF